METTHPLRLLDERTGEVLLVLDGEFAPEAPLRIGTRLRKSRAHYHGARSQTTHVLGVEEDDLTVEGLLDDTCPGGVPGQAARMAAQLAGVLRRGRRAVLEWGELQRPGLVDELQLDMETEGAYRYRFVFHPDESPGAKETPWQASVWQVSELNFSVMAADVQRPRSILDQWRSVRTRVMGAWRAANPLRLELLQYLWTVENTIASLSNMARDFAGVLAMSRDTAERVTQLTRSMETAYDSFVTDLRAAVRPAASEETLDDIRDQVTMEDAAGAARLAHARLIQMIRAALEREMGPDTTREHIVQAGQTLLHVALLYYGDADEWSRVYQTNNLTSTRLSPGQRLRIPE
jgi:hypothetical protein